MSEDKVLVTVSEFKNWLSGVLDFQPEDWVPDAGQWEKILNKINSLDETMVQQLPVQPSNPHMPDLSDQPKPSGRNPNPQPVNRNPRPQAPLAGSGVKLPDVKVKKVKPQITVQDTGDVGVVDEGGKKVVQTGKTYRTGSIDTSDGEYQSQFS